MINNSDNVIWRRNIKVEPNGETTESVRTLNESKKCENNSYDMSGSGTFTDTIEIKEEVLEDLDEYPYLRDNEKYSSYEKEKESRHVLPCYVRVDKSEVSRYFCSETREYIYSSVNFSRLRHQRTLQQIQPCIKSESVTVLQNIEVRSLPSIKTEVQETVNKSNKPLPTKKSVNTRKTGSLVVEDPNFEVTESDGEYSNKNDSDVESSDEISSVNNSSSLYNKSSDSDDDLISKKQTEESVSSEDNSEKSEEYCGVKKKRNKRFCYTLNNKSKVEMCNICKRDNSLRESYKCHLCKKLYTQSCHVLRHIYSVHSVAKQFKCSYCNIKVKRKGDLQYHINIVHLKLKPFNCKLCDRTFGKKNRLIEHVKTVHMKVKKVAKYFCSLCKNKSFKYSVSLRRHMISYHENGEKKYKCPKCDMKFFQSYRLKRHLASKYIHSAAKQFKCKFCPRKFTTERSMVNHVNMTHNKSKMAVICDICKAIYYSKSTLSRHLFRVHLKEK